MRYRFGRSQSSRPDPPNAIAITPIASVHNRIRQSRSSGWESVESDITLDSRLQPELLADLDGFSHILVIFWIDDLGANRPQPLRIPIGVSARPGVLATRSQLRPNPIGVSVVSLRGIEGATLHVIGLDAIDGTPVLDLKPYIPHYDSVPTATVPPWVYGE